MLDDVEITLLFFGRSEFKSDFVQLLKRRFGEPGPPLRFTQMLIQKQLFKGGFHKFYTSDSPWWNAIQNVTKTI